LRTKEQIKEYQRQYREKHRDKAREASLRWREKNLTRSREYARRYRANEGSTYYEDKYGITIAELDAMWESQKGLCGICCELLEDKYHVDHDHASGKVRSLSHGYCNLLLGVVEKKRELIDKIFVYLEKHS
jgi:Recombination endonuclease VII